VATRRVPGEDERQGPRRGGVGAAGARSVAPGDGGVRQFMSHCGWNLLVEIGPEGGRRHNSL
jgi:hypothetical protein